MKQKLLFFFALLCMVAQGAWAGNVINLSSHDSGAVIVASDGDELTGELTGGTIYIQGGATVTLNSVNLKPIKGISDSNGRISCMGDAIIILKGRSSIESNKCSPISVKGDNTTLTIEGDGWISVKGDVKYAGIGGKNSNLVIDITGSITAESTTIKEDILFVETEEGGGDGIGSGREGNFRTITINNGTINTCGGAGAAGIGGGIDTSITINGGSINAWAGNKAAGIGGNGASVTINGGNITAHGGKYAAGIGSGESNVTGQINITGGTIKAYGGTDAAGIGGGEDSNSGSIVITGGDVYAKGEGYGVGIGAGEDGDVNNISISGGKVEALGGDDINRAIGGEDDEDFSNIIIGDELKVTDVSSGSALSYTYKSSFMRSFYQFYKHLKFEPCDHAGQTLSYTYVNQYKHKFMCQWCYWKEEDHTGDFECTKCVYGATPLHVHYYEMVYDEQSHQYKYQEKEAEAVHSYSIIIIHAPSNAAPADHIFVGWVEGEPDANDDGLLKNNESLLSVGTGFLIENSEKHYKARYVYKTLDLSTVQSDQTVYDGMTVTGTLDTEHHPVKITIANNATVTLSNVEIIGVNDKENNNYKWAGITCEGNATIILADGTTNTVKGFYEDYPGIYVPQNYTLAIKGETAGTGSLNASSNGFGAGIGSGYASSVSFAGTIKIQGGVITATGGKYAAGIGSNHNNSCGNINITGGTIDATGGQDAAGIGSGWGGTNQGDFSSCGMISITSGVTSVTATKGTGAPNSIGAGTGNSTCGSVAIGSKTGAKSWSPYNYVPLGNAANNSSKISDFENEACDVTLKDRTLYKDGAWNTLCLPFSISDFSGTPLEGATVTTLESASFDSTNDELTLNFSDPVTTLAAGTPYLIKWVEDEDADVDFVIRTADDWNTFAQNVNNGTEDYSGKIVALAADIMVSSMVGSNTVRSFKGTFNGNGHTLIYEYSESTQYNAPFRYVNGATISNLHITGNRTEDISGTSVHYSSGLVACAIGTNTINNCWSSLNINYSGITYGGFVADIEGNNSTITLNNCLFDGMCIGADSKEKSEAETLGGFVGENGGMAKLNNCVFRPVYINFQFGFGHYATFSFGNAFINNCYYSEKVPNSPVQGMAIGEMTNEELLAALGDGWEIKNSKVVPGIMKFEKPNIENPMFTNVTITTTTPTDITPNGSGSDGSVTFKGTFDPVTFGADGDNTKLYLGDNNKLYWPSGAKSINSFRAYFQLNGITAGSPSSSGVREFVLNFDGGEQTGITTTNYTDTTNSDDAWYDLSGRKLSGKPTTKGLYINNGKKVVIK